MVFITHQPPIQEIYWSGLDAFDISVHMSGAEGMTAGSLPALILPSPVLSQLLQGTHSWSCVPKISFVRDNDIRNYTQNRQNGEFDSIFTFFACY